MKKSIGNGVVWNNAEEWEFLPSPVTMRGRRAISVTSPAAELPPGVLESGKVRVEKTFQAVPKPTAVRRSGGIAMLDLSVPVGPGEGSVLLVRRFVSDSRGGPQSRSTVTFHRPEEHILTRRTGTRVAAPALVRFRVPVRRSAPPSAAPQRRGIIGAIVHKAIEVTILKIVDVAADVALPILAERWEKRSWEKERLSEGWLRVDREKLAAKKLDRWQPEKKTLVRGRSLLLLHGTFSNAGSAFHELAKGDFFDRIKPLYGDRIFAFDHFSVSRTPEQNARMLVEALPDGVFEFDVITHSRGGLVLRNLVEKSAALGVAGQRFRLGHAVLVASPNEGTPLATPERWERTVGWIANLLEMFPDNPFTTGASWIGEAIVWLARHASGNLPGINSMNAAGDLISELQAPPAPPADAYSVLAANFSPDDRVWMRLLDLGIDSFFAQPNDLVVPTAGGWHIDKGVNSYVPPERIGCFGAGGNLADSVPVHHLNFFQQPDSAAFIVDALTRKPHPLRPIDPLRLLPGRRAAGAVAGRFLPRAGEAIDRRDEPMSAPSVEVAQASRMVEPLGVAPGSLAPVDTFFLSVLETSNEQPEASERKGDQVARSAQLLASYGGASVLVPFHRSGGEAGQRFNKIIRMQERLRNYIDGKPGTTLPKDAELIDFGKLLFETLFPSDVRRLYDVARSLRGSERLDLIFTSMIPWIAEKPWEFAYDPQRGAFLATEEIHFVRNVLTPIPAEEISERDLPLRILVVAPQPVGAAGLSTEEEIELISRDFKPLVEIGAVAVEVLPHATPMSFHGYISTGHFDVVHFIGHGEFLDDSGALLFEGTRGTAQSLTARTLREIMCQRGIRLVFLNACESGRGSRRQLNTGAAAALVAGGLPAAVANQYKVLDQSATSFAQFFYWALAQGMSVARAAREARIALKYSIEGETIDWAVPVLYARNPRANFCPRIHAGGMGRPVAPPITAPSGRRAIAGHVYRIGVWDVAHDFAGLEIILARMNAAQQRFGFELVTLSAPIGTWQLSQDVKHRAFLDANKVVGRLRNKPNELGIDALICITNQPMGGREKGREVAKNLYAWWDDPKKPVMLISMAGFKFPSEDENVLEKAIANTIALCLAGQFAQIDSHSRLPRECLLFRNETRSLEVLAGQRNLEPKCRQQLKQKIPEDLPAIEALLNAFPSAQTATDKGRGRAHPAVRPPKKSSRTTKQRQ